MRASWFCIPLAAATVVLGLVGIWSGDDRWSATAAVIGFAAASAGLIWLFLEDS